VQNGLTRGLIDITYVPTQLKKSNSHHYVYSRYIVGRGLSNTLDAEASLQVLKVAVAFRHGKPVIKLVSDQAIASFCKGVCRLPEGCVHQYQYDGRGRALFCRKVLAHD